MTGVSDATIWMVIAALGAGTFFIRWSFIGLVGDRPLPPLMLRLLRFVPVTVIPALVAPAVLWPKATGGETDPARLAAAMAALAAGALTRNMLWAILAGGGTLFAGLWATGQIAL